MMILGTNQMLGPAAQTIGRPARNSAKACYENATPLKIGAEAKRCLLLVSSPGICG